ncbi:MAG: imidazole glycerol phosphate synthase subunit HisH [Cyclobacteriaceae bacterium]
MKIAIVKYNAGNLQSVIYALQRLGIEPLVTNQAEELRSADKVIFPGVGEAASAMKSLKENKLDILLPTLKQPFLGICLGLQLMCRHSEERDTTCLGVFDLEVKKFEPKMKVPHMGWNKLENMKTPLFNQLNGNAFVYFVHSYYAEVGEGTIATAEYINTFSAALHKDNFYAIQAHPEKSGEVGAKIISNFLNL